MREITTPTGRTIAVEEWGVPGGTPVLYLHGSPMSRLARYPDDALFERLGVRLVTFDRPGFGRSTPQPGRSVADGAADVAAVADALGLARLPLFGVSGGGPHALAFAAAYPERVTRVASLAALAPRDAEGLDWTAGMMEGNVRSARAAAIGRDAVLARLADNPPGMPALPEREREVLARPEVRAMLDAAFAEAVRPGPDGWADDVRALFGLPWGFDPADVTVPARLWHGALDTVVPAAHARWLAARMPTAEAEIEDGAGHAGHFAATPAILEWLVSGE